MTIPEGNHPDQIISNLGRLIEHHLEDLQTVYFRKTRRHWLGYCSKVETHSKEIEIIYKQLDFKEFHLRFDRRWLNKSGYKLQG